MPKVGMQPIRRQQLIHATLSAVNELGFADASISQIAKRAGVSTGIISHYFDGKHGLIEATMRYLLQQLGESIAAALQSAGELPEQRLIAIVRANFSASQTDKAAMKTCWHFGPAVCINLTYIVCNRSIIIVYIQILNMNLKSI